MSQPCWNAWESCELQIRHECLTSYRFLINRQPAKALPYFLRLRRPDVFDLIREHNLFTAVQDQVVKLIEFDRGQLETRLSKEKHGAAIQLLVDHIHSIPVSHNSQ